MKTWLKILIAAILAVIVAFLLIVGIFIYRMEYKTKLIAVSISPDEQYKIFLNQVGDPDFPFGPVKARIVLKQGSKTVETYDTEVWDDGAVLSEFSWSVAWDEYSVTVILTGSEQEPETVSFLLEK